MMADYNEIKRVSKIYDLRASKSNSFEAAGQWGSKELVSQITNEIIQKIQLKKNDVVLEVGCGSGVLGKAIIEKCDMYIGFDVSKLMLKKFKEEVSKTNQIDLIQASATHIPIRDNWSNKIIMNGVSMYFPNKEFLINVLGEIKRVTKNRSLIFIGENIIPSKYQWELVWFENLSSIGQALARPYIRLRRWLVKLSPHLGGKWKDAHRDISPKIVKNFFKNNPEFIMTDSAAYSIRKKIYGEKAKGNQRMDFVITFNG